MEHFYNNETNFNPANIENNKDLSTEGTKKLYSIIDEIKVKEGRAVKSDINYYTGIIINNRIYFDDDLIFKMDMDTDTPDI